MLTPEGLLHLPFLRVQNANAISSPLTWGFPPPSAFTGFVHALSRGLAGAALSMDGVAIVCHRFEPQVSTPSGKRTKVFHLTRNPGGREGKPQAIVEEARAHLEVSLLIGLNGDGLQSGQPLERIAPMIAEFATAMRLAGGSIVPQLEAPLRKRPQIYIWPGDSHGERKLTRRLQRKLLPGFALVSREGMLESRLNQIRAFSSEATTLDALLDLSSLNFDPPPEGQEDGEWSIRRKPGWLVPIPAGYNALSDLYPPGVVQNTRDRETPFRFVEGVYTLGQWLSPHRVDDIRQLLWEHRANPETGEYICTTPHFAASGLPTEGT